MSEGKENEKKGRGEREREAVMAHSVVKATYVERKTMKPGILS